MQPQTFCGVSDKMADAALTKFDLILSACFNTVISSCMNRVLYLLKTLLHLFDQISTFCQISTIFYCFSSSTVSIGFLRRAQK